MLCLCFVLFDFTLDANIELRAFANTRGGNTNDFSKFVANCRFSLAEFLVQYSKMNWCHYWNKPVLYGTLDL